MIMLTQNHVSSCLYGAHFLRRFIYVLGSNFSTPSRSQCTSLKPINEHSRWADIEKQLLHYKKAVQKQGTFVRSLKEAKASKDELDKAIAELKSRKQILAKKEQELCPPIEKIDKSRLENLLKQRFFYEQSFAIYGGAQGLYDLGPMGCAVKNNLVQEWRAFFVLHDHMLEVDCPVLTPEAVLKASGHVDRFTDYLVADVETGESFRADHLIGSCLSKVLENPRESHERRQEAKTALRSLESLDEERLQVLLDRWHVKSPVTGRELTAPRKFSLMLETSTGAGASSRSFLRPETAQGIFTNFRRLLDFNNGRLPLSVAQVGQSFRNEVSPRSGLLRLREFALAEVEHFYDPQVSAGRHPGFESLAGLHLPLLSADDQAAGADGPAWLSLGEAFNSGQVASQALGYFLARVFLFLTDRCRLDPRRLRLRQHPPAEMAHYASDCWDAECLLTLHDGATAWVECVGCADRAAFDLTRHAEATGARLRAERQVVDSCSSNPPATEEFVPSVVEPSFGLGRILAAVFEHSFRARPGHQSGGNRTLLSLPPWLAPYQCSLLPMGQGVSGHVTHLSMALTRAGLRHLVDDARGGASIGKRYARTDQVGVPFGVTFDADTAAAGDSAGATVTLRERDSMEQVRVQLDAIPDLIRRLVHEEVTWDEVKQSHAAFGHRQGPGNSEN